MKTETKFYYSRQCGTVIGVFDGDFYKGVNGIGSKSVSITRITETFDFSIWLKTQGAMVFKPCPFDFAMNFIKKISKEMTKATATVSDSRLGFLLRSNANFMNLPENYRDELQNAMTNKYGKDVLTTQYPTPIQVAEFEDLVDAYYAQFNEQVASLEEAA